MPFPQDPKTFTLYNYGTGTATISSLVFATANGTQHRADLSGFGASTTYTNPTLTGLSVSLAPAASIPFILDYTNSTGDLTSYNNILTVNGTVNGFSDQASLDAVVVVSSTPVVDSSGGGGGGGDGGSTPSGCVDDGISSTCSASGGDGGGGKIICTRLYELGLMSKEIYLADQAFGAELVKSHPDIYNGYRAWAEIVVDWMDGRGPKMMPWMTDEEFSQSIKKWSIKWAQDIATPWAEEMAYQMKESMLPNNTGKAIMAIGTPICKIVGVWQRVVGPSKKPAGFGKGLMLIPVFVLLKLVAELGRLIEPKLRNTRN